MLIVFLLEKDLIGRTPGQQTEKGAASKPKRSSSPTFKSSSRPLSPVILSRPSYKLETVIREPYTAPLPVYRSKVADDLDLEVATLTSTPTYKTIPRSKSPLTYRASFLERYGYDPIDPLTLRPYSPYYYYTRSLTLERELERKRRLARVYDSYYRSIDDIDLELRLARLRAARALY